MPKIDMGKLRERLISAALLAPVTLFLIWYGSWPFALMVMAAIIITFFEWHNMAKKLTEPHFMSIIGAAYILISCGSFYFLRSEFSFAICIYFIVLIWSSDTGAYFAGKMIGGPKMAPSISPNKTWAGFGGAVLTPGLLAVIGVLFFDLHDRMPLPNDFVLFCALCVGALIGVIGQGGDLLISMLKRKSGLKDTGALIPGHGGLLDRIDSLLPNAPFFLLVAYTVKYGL